MKGLLFLFFLTSSTLSIAQTPPKKATKVIVHVRDSAGTLMNRIAVVLFDKGYTIENRNDSLKLMATGEKSHPKQSVSTKLRLSLIHI